MEGWFRHEGTKTRRNTKKRRKRRKKKRRKERKKKETSNIKHRASVHSVH